VWGSQLKREHTIQSSAAAAAAAQAHCWWWSVSMVRSFVHVVHVACWSCPCSFPMQTQHKGWHAPPARLVRATMGCK